MRPLSLLQRTYWVGVDCTLSFLNRELGCGRNCCSHAGFAQVALHSDRTPRRVRIAPNLYQRPSDGKFEIGFSDTGGRWRIKTLRARTRTEAKAERDLFMTRLRAGEVAAPSKVTLAEVSAEYIAGLEAMVAAGERAPRTLER